MTPLYVVTVQHSTGHGPMVSVALVTPNLVLATDTARKVRTMAYEFCTDDGVTVSMLRPGVVYDHKPGSLSRAHSTPTNQDAQIFWAIKNREGSWDESWGEFWGGPKV
jgi:hypothetical protein